MEEREREMEAMTGFGSSRSSSGEFSVFAARLVDAMEVAFLFCG